MNRQAADAASRGRRKSDDALAQVTSTLATALRWFAVALVFTMRLVLAVAKWSIRTARAAHRMARSS